MVAWNDQDWFWQLSQKVQRRKQFMRAGALRQIATDGDKIRSQGVDARLECRNQPRLRAPEVEIGDVDDARHGDSLGLSCTVV